MYGELAMVVNLIRIGNSQGIRLPKAVIEQANLSNELDLQVVDGAVIIRSSRKTRTGWAVAAAACHQDGQDQLGDWDVTLNDMESQWE